MVLAPVLVAAHHIGKLADLLVVPVFKHMWLVTGTHQKVVGVRAVEGRFNFIHIT
jgi:hypothetical protein